MPTWQRWAAAERLAVQDTNWVAVVGNDGCAPEHVVIEPVAHAEAAGIPRGVVADAVHRRPAQAARRRTSQMVTAMSSTESISSQPASMNWKCQYRVSGW
jgi:hypothetical protein